MTRLIAIGFWADSTYADWPDPDELIVLDGDEDERREVACYLDGGTIVQVWRE